MKKAYTLATYTVLPGKEEDFVRVWHNLAATFRSLPHPPYWGTLIRSRADRRLFHSFGPWEDASHVMAMRDNPNAAGAFQQLHALVREHDSGRL